MAHFEPCHGKNACRDNGERCLTCNRSSSEIARLRAAVDELANLAIEHGYANTEEFASYVSTVVRHGCGQRAVSHGLGRRGDPEGTGSRWKSASGLN